MAINLQSDKYMNVKVDKGIHGLPTFLATEWIHLTVVLYLSRNVSEKSPVPTYASNNIFNVSLIKFNLNCIWEHNWIQQEDNYI